MKYKAIKFLEDNIQENLIDLGYGEDFSHTPPPKTQSMKEVNNLDFIKINSSRDFPGGPVVKNQLCNARDMGSISGQGTKIPQAVEQLSPPVTTTEPAHSGARVPLLESLCTSVQDPS